jgi:hypothetical protein
MESKVFRVLISDTQSFYLDTEAADEQEAMRKVRALLDDPRSDAVPSEDNSAYEGYKVEDAVEIKREDSDLA